MNKRTVIVTCLALLALSGCVSVKAPEVTSPPLPSPQDILEKIIVPDSGDALRATARISFSSPAEGNYTRKMALLLRLPCSLRLEAIPLFGPVDFFLSANKDALKVFFPGEGKFYVGAATRENLSLFFKVPLSPADMVPLLAGVPPEIPGGRLSGQMEGGLYRVDIRSGKRKRSLWVDPVTRTLTRIEEIDDDRILWRAAFEDRIVVGGKSYPTGIQVEVGGPEGVKMEIRYLDLDTSPVTGMAIFDLPIPPGITLIPINR